MSKLFATLLLAAMLVAAVQPAGALSQVIVFFAGSESGQLGPVQWRIGPEAEAVIKSAAVQHGLFGGHIVLTAGDERFGSLENSIERSRRRTDAVRNVLVKHGVERADIFTRPCGFVHVLVETPPETKEPMNRFVTIDLADEGETLVDGSRDGCARARALKL